MVKAGRRQGTGSGDSANGRTLMVVAGILGTQLAAVAINSATSTVDPWPVGLEHVRQHPFGWSAALTALLAVCGLATVWMDRRNARVTAGRTAEKIIFLQLRELRRYLENIGTLANWCRTLLGTTLSGAAAPAAIEAKKRVAELERSVFQQSAAIGDLVDRLFGRLRARAESDFVVAGVRSAPSVTTNEPRIDYLRGLPEAQGPNVGAAAISITLVVEHLNQLNRELGDFTIDIVGVQGQIDRLSQTADEDFSTVAHVTQKIDEWQQALQTSADLLDQYVTAIGVDRARHYFDDSPIQD